MRSAPSLSPFAFDQILGADTSQFKVCLLPRHNQKIRWKGTPSFVLPHFIGRDAARDLTIVVANPFGRRTSFENGRGSRGNAALASSFVYLGALSRLSGVQRIEALDVCCHAGPATRALDSKEHPMNGIIYLVGLIVVVMAVLSLVGLH